jgi:hypothetical protein
MLQAAKNTMAKPVAQKILAVEEDAPVANNQAEEQVVEKPVVLDKKAQKRAELKRKAKEREQIRETKRLRECALMEAEENAQREMVEQLKRDAIEREKVLCVKRQQWGVSSDDVELSPYLATKERGSIGYDFVTSGVHAEHGTHYWEVKLEHIGQGIRFFVGVARLGLNPKGEYHSSADAWFIRMRDGQRWGNSQYSQDIAGKFCKGDRVGLLLDMEAGALFFYKNGERHGPGFAAGSIDGPVAVAMQLGGEGYSARLNPTAEWPAEWEKDKGEMSGEASVNKAHASLRKVELTRRMNQEAHEYALQAAIDARAAVTVMLEAVLPIVWQHWQQDVLSAYEAAVTSARAVAAPRGEMGRFQEGAALALISAAGALPRSTRVQLKSDPVMQGEIVATHVGGVALPQTGLMEPPLLNAGTRYSVEFDSHLVPPPPSLGDVATVGDQSSALEVDSLEVLEVGQEVLVYRNDGRWTYGKVIKRAGDPDSEDEYSDYSEEEDEKEDGGGEDGGGGVKKDEAVRVVVLTDERGSRKVIPQEWSTELKQLPIRQTPRFDGGELQVVGVSEYDWWCKAVVGQKALARQAVGPSLVETNYNFTCVWTEGLLGHCTRAHDCPSDKCPKEAPWFCRQLGASYETPPPLPPCGNCAWVEPWTRNVMACAMDGQELRFGYLLHPLDVEEQPEFKCTASGYEGYYYVGKGQKVELEWAQNKMGLVVKPIESKNMIAGSAARACIDACGRICTRIEAAKRRDAKRALYGMPQAGLASGATDGVQMVLESMDVMDWAFLHWRPEAGGLIEMAEAESRARAAVAKARLCVDRAMEVEMVELDAKLPHAATYAPTKWALHSNRVALNGDGSIATKVIGWDVELDDAHDLEQEDWDLIDGDQKKAMELVRGVCAEVTDADRRARSAGWWRTADLVASGDPMLHRGKYRWAVEIMCKQVTGFYVGVVRDPRRSGLGQSLNYTDDDTETQGTQSSPDGWFMHAVTGELWGNGKMGEDRAGGFVQGDRVGMLLDLHNRSLLFFKNGVQHGPGYLPGSVTGPVVVAVQMMHKGQQAKLTTVTRNRRHCHLAFPLTERAVADADKHDDIEKNMKLATKYNRSLGLKVLKHDVWLRTKIQWAVLGSGQSKRVHTNKGKLTCRNSIPYQGEECTDPAGIPRLALQLEKKKIKKEQYHAGVAKLTEGKCIHCHRDKESHGTSQARQIASKEGGDEVCDLVITEEELTNGKHYFELQLIELPDKEEELAALAKKKGHGKIVKGSTVEANFKKKGQYCAGKIARVRMNGLFDIDYDDGARETEVDKQQIRLVEDLSDVPRYYPYVGVSKLGLHAMDDKTQRESTDVWFMSTSDGGLYGNGEQADRRAGGFEQGDTVGMLLDLDEGSLLFFKNGVQHGGGYAAGTVTASELAPVTVAVQMNYTECSVRLLPDIPVPTEEEQQARREAVIQMEEDRETEAAERTKMEAEEKWSKASSEENKVLTHD